MQWVPRQEPGNQGVPLSPVGADVDDAGLACVITGTAVPPMNRIVDVTTTQRIVVDVLDLLPHHVVRFDDFGMAAFLPYLKVLVDLVPQFVVLQFLKQSLVSHLLHLADNRTGCERLVFGDTLCELWTNRDPVKVVFHHDKTKDVDVACLL